MAGKKKKTPLNLVPSPSSASPPIFLSTFDRESRYPIFITFCDCLSIADILALTQTCKELSGLYRYLLPIQWDVDKALRHYVDDPKDFRSQMAKYDALIDGTFANEFFERAVCDRDLLSVTIQQGLGPQLFSKYLSDIVGYSEVKLEEFDQNHLTAEIRTFKRESDSRIVIVLHVTNCPPPQSILLGTNTTGEVNIISWNKAYSIFPLPTFIQRKSYLLQGYDGLTENAVRHHARRGLDVQGVMWPEEKRRNHPIQKRRRIGDRHTWTIHFDTRSVEVSQTPDYVLEHTCFTMNLDVSYDDDRWYHAPKEDVRHYTIQANTLQSKVLKHTYLYGVDDMGEFFSRRLHSFTVLELRKLDPAKRPTNYDQILGNLDDIDGLLGDFERPASWRYRDEDFPRWYKAFEMYKPE